MMATAEEEIRRRLLDVAPEPNESLPYHGRVRLARRKKADAWYIKAAEVKPLGFRRAIDAVVSLGSSALFGDWLALRHLLSFRARALSRQSLLRESRLQRGAA